MLEDWNGLDEVAEVTEGLGMGGGDCNKCQTLELQELGGYMNIYIYIYRDIYMYIHIYVYHRDFLNVSQRNARRQFTLRIKLSP
jgi:hypothetical protein